MTRVGDDIIRNCRNCFCRNGYGIHLREHSQHQDIFECPHCRSTYVIRAGFLHPLV